MSNDWERPKNVVHPKWNNGYQRYDLSIDEVIQKIIDSGYDLKKIEEPEEDEFDGIYTDDAEYILELHSEKGFVVSPEIALILKPKIFRDGIDITEEADMRHFKWVRSSSDSKGDAEWNLRHATGIKDLYITHEDVYKRAIFHCAFLTGASESQFVQNMYAAYVASTKQ